MALNFNSSCFSTALSVCLECAIVSELDFLGGCDGYFPGVPLGAGGADELGVIECDVAAAVDVDVSGCLVTFGVAFYVDFVEVEVAGTVDGDLA